MGAYCSIPLTSPPWYATFFLDPGIKWCHVVFGGIEFIHAVPWLALAFLVWKAVLERSVAGPLGEWLNVKDKSYSCPSRQPTLERAYGSCPRPGQEMLQQLSVDVGWSPYRVYKWFTRKRHCRKASQLSKFKESSWKCLVHSVAMVFGLVVLAKENFFWDLSRCFSNYPANVPSTGVMTYWTAELAFYISTILSHPYDCRKSDYKLLLLHYLLMVSTLSLSYMLNAIQVGVLMVFMHNLADVPLEIAKILKYCHYESQAKFAFIVYGVLFFITRMVVYPFYLLYNAVFQFPVSSAHPPAYWIFITALSLTQLMYVYWFKLISSMLWSLLTEKEKKELHSESEPSQEFMHEDVDTAHWCSSRVYKSHCS